MMLPPTRETSQRLGYLLLDRGTGAEDHDRWTVVRTTTDTLAAMAVEAWISGERGEVRLLRVSRRVARTFLVRFWAAHERAGRGKAPPGFARFRLLLLAPLFCPSDVSAWLGIKIDEVAHERAVRANAVARQSRRRTA